MVIKNYCTATCSTEPPSTMRSTATAAQELWICHHQDLPVVVAPLATGVDAAARALRSPQLVPPSFSTIACASTSQPVPLSSNLYMVLLSFHSILFVVIWLIVLFFFFAGGGFCFFTKYHQFWCYLKTSRKKKVIFSHVFVHASKNLVICFNYPYF